MNTLTAAQRRVVAWGLLLSVLLLALAGAVTVFRRALGGFGFGTPAAPVISQQLVVERLQQVARLVASEMTLRDVVTYEQTQFRSTKRLLLVVTAKVAAGIDLSRNTDVSIDSATRRITVSLPPAQVMSIDVVSMRTYDERAGLWNPFRAEDRDMIQRTVRTRLQETALQSGILEHANRNAEKVLIDLLARDGYTVVIRRPPVQVTPAR